MQTTRMTDSTSNVPVLYVALELSKDSWKMAFTDGLGRVPRLRTILSGDHEGLMREISVAKSRFGLPEDAPVVSCYEAGRDGFWIHRWLTAFGIENFVIDPASIEVNRRRRRAKTDAIDAERMVMALIRFRIGDRDACRAVNVPAPEDEDARQIHREIDCLMAERTAHINRIKGLLFTQGIKVEEITESLPTQLDGVKTGDGRELAPLLKDRVIREFQRLQLLVRQIRELEKLRANLFRHAMRATEADELPEWLLIAELLRSLCGIGEHASMVLATEMFAWRDLKNRRQVAAIAGLTPSPWQSGGSVNDEQGISKAGRGPLRALLIEIAWGWVQFQPNNPISQWFYSRFARGNSRQRRIGIVAVARKLLVALWKMFKFGEVPINAKYTKNPRQFRYTPALG